MSRKKYSDADAVFYELRRADKLLDAMDGLIRGILFQPYLRRKLMALKDEIKGGLTDATTRVRAMNQRIAAQIARITELESQPGNWTDEDVAGIKADLVALNAEFGDGTAPV